MSSAAGDGKRHPSLPPGTLLGPYAIEAAIGAEGMGEVYRVSDTRLGRPVILNWAEQLEARVPAGR